MSLESAQRVAESLKLSRDKHNWFCQSVESEHNRSPKYRAWAAREVEKYRRLDERVDLRAEQVNVAHWYHFAIRRLTQVKGFVSEPEWIATRLNLPVELVEKAIEELLAAGALERRKGGDLQINSNFVIRVADQSGRDMVAEVIRESLKELNQRSIESSRRIPSGLRDQALHFFALRKSQIPKIKEMLRDFEDKVDALTYEAETEGGSDTLVCLMTHLFPLTPLPED